MKLCPDCCPQDLALDQPMCIKCASVIPLAVCKTKCPECYLNEDGACTGIHKTEICMLPGQCRHVRCRLEELFNKSVPLDIVAMVTKHLNRIKGRFQINIDLNRIKGRFQINIEPPTVMPTAGILKGMYNPLPMIVVKCRTREAKSYIENVAKDLKGYSVMYYNTWPYTRISTRHTFGTKRIHDYTHVLILSAFTMKWFYYNQPYVSYFKINR
jgi:hypothetical protein